MAPIHDAEPTMVTDPQASVTTGLARARWKELGVQTFGLDPSLHVPIAAASVETIERFVGSVRGQLTARNGRVNAVLVAASRPDPRLDSARVPLWHEPEPDRFWLRLHPELQVWVHVDYSGYRRAWHRFGMQVPDPDVFFDHIQNREAVRLSGYTHPYIRICPVSRAVNTSGGANAGGEGMEKDLLRRLREHPAEMREAAMQRSKRPSSSPTPWT